MIPTPAVLVRHAGGTYPVYVERGLLAKPGDVVRRHLAGRALAIVADTTVASLYGDHLRTQLSDVTQRSVPLLSFPPGELHKTRDVWARLTDELIAHRIGRDAAIVALGGGVTGDLAGFVAATLHRGIPLLQVPTTLIAMVDSAIGGKTGVNTPAGKNLVGAFHPPVAVAADPAVLATLPDAEYRGGLAEAVKHGLMLDRAYLDWIEAETAALGARDLDAVTRLVEWSARLKAEVVSEDERESGRRALLNAGHTVAHALEKTSGWQVPHGQAVAVGLVTEARIAAVLGLGSDEVPRRLSRILRALGLPTSVAETAAPGLDAGALVSAMEGDKKNRAAVRPAEIRFAFPANGAGDPAEWTTGVASTRVLEALSVTAE